MGFKLQYINLDEMQPPQLLKPKKQEKGREGADGEGEVQTGHILGKKAFQFLNQDKERTSWPNPPHTAWDLELRGNMSIFNHILKGEIKVCVVFFIHRLKCNT